MPKLKRDLTMEQQLSRGPMDLPFLMLVVMLTAIGVIMVFSASYATALHEGRSATYYFIRQAIFAVAGLAAMYIISKINYQHFRWMSVFILGLALVLLVAVLIPGVHTVRADHVKRWIRSIGPIPAFQPSEVAKLGVILYFSARMAKRETEKKRKFDLHTTQGRLLKKMDEIGLLELMPYGIILLIIIFLMYKEPHMSGTILILVPAAAILFAGGVKLGWFAAGGTVVVTLLTLIITQTSYMAARIKIWQDPWSDPRNDGFQFNPFTPSAREACSEWALAKAARPSCFSPRRKTTVSSLWPVRSWALWELASSCFFLPCLFFGAIGSPSMPGTALEPCWWWGLLPSSRSRCSSIFRWSPTSCPPPAFLYPSSAMEAPRL